MKNIDGSQGALEIIAGDVGILYQEWPDGRNVLGATT